MPARKTEPIDNSCDRHDERRSAVRAQWIQAAATVVAGVAGLLGLLFLRGTLSATRSAAEAAKASANAELASVRAWMIPYDIVVPQVSDLKPGSSFDIDLQNNGKTAALDPLFLEEFAFWEKNSAQRPFHFASCPMEPPLDRTTRFGSVIPQRVGRFGTKDFTLRLNADQKAKLQANAAAILVHACMWYGIVPPGQPTGLTDYCSMAYLSPRSETLPCSENRTTLH